MAAPPCDWNTSEVLLREILHQRLDQPTYATIASAHWSNGVGPCECGLVLLADGRPTEPATTRVYPTLRLVKAAVAGDDIVKAVLENLSRSGAEPRHAYVERVVSESPGAWPYWELRLQLGNGQRPTNDAVIAFGLPPRGDANAAVGEWLGDGRWSPGEWRIRVSDTRARIREVRFSGEGVLHVAVETVLPSADTEVQVVYGTGGPRDEGDARAPLKGTEARIQAPGDTDYATVYLVASTNEILDRARAQREPRQPTPDEEIELAQRCEADIANGEREDVELKPWIVPKNAKEHEIVKTIVAFANTVGGRLYIGVHSSGAPQGAAELNKAFRSEHSNTDGSAEAAAQAWVRELIQEKLRRCPPIDTHMLQVHGAPVLCVVVKPGDRGPYATADNEVLVRKGASNRRPDPHSELPKLVTDPTAGLNHWIDGRFRRL